MALAISAGIDGIPTNTIPDDPAQFVSWFKSVGIKRWLANADTRNAISGTGISITGTVSTPATVSVSNDVAALFVQPYVLVGGPVAPAVLTDYRSLAAQSGVLSLTDAGAEGSLTVGVATNGIGNAQLRQGVAASVIGNAGSVLTNVADIFATVDGQTLVRSGGTLSFAALQIGQLASIANNTVVGNVIGSAGVPVALNQTQLTALIDLATTGASGALPQLDGNTAHFLNGNGVFTTPAYTTGANPSSKVALAVVNGTASTWMRSDAAPALDVTIAPTWTGLHTFSPSSGSAIVANAVAGTAALQIVGATTSYAAVALKDGNTGTRQFELRAGNTTGYFDIFDDTLAASRFQIQAPNNKIYAYGPTAAGLVELTPDKGTAILSATGLTTTPTGSAVWSRVGNLVVLYIPTINGTSNATTFTLTGLPAVVQPARTQTISVPVAVMDDNGAAIATASLQVTPSSGTITFLLNNSATGWTNAAATKGVVAAFSVSYLLN